ncbi:hypothetical protein SUGI_0417970 [Cryptomeria japonica]|uniref:uncharacterized protein LOC131036111 n=1 Tax=Cryptomeria japonica TaxID=3369 RepID=UPI002408D937|nr:uncharacterized protein LOC131036111 [Cryptomeria japonica]GLJ22235.1 hypothetical protein SUGI_0417970 [Cryptomeria japonica]
MEEDMDTPEEVTLVEGKEEASNLRKTERENQRRVTVEAKKRRKQQAAKKEELQLQLKVTNKAAGLNEEDQQVIGSHDKSRSKESFDPMFAEDKLSFGSAKKDGMLPDSIVNFLAGREKHLQLSLTETDAKLVASTLKPKKKKMKIKQNSNGTGRVQVVVLKDLSSLERVQNAKQFLQDRQSHVHRSASMLKHFKGFPFLSRRDRAQ